MLLLFMAPFRVQLSKLILGKSSKSYKSLNKFTKIQLTGESNHVLLEETHDVFLYHLTY